MHFKFIANNANGNDIETSSESSRLVSSPFNFFTRWNLSFSFSYHLCHGNVCIFKKDVPLSDTLHPQRLATGGWIVCGAYVASALVNRKLVEKMLRTNEKPVCGLLNVDGVSSRKHSHILFADKLSPSGVLWVWSQYCAEFERWKIFLLIHSLLLHFDIIPTSQLINCSSRIIWWMRWNVAVHLRHICEWQFSLLFAVFWQRTH